MSYLLVAIVALAEISADSVLGVRPGYIADAGVLIGRRLLHKVTMKKVQVLTGMLLLIIALAPGTGII